MQKGKNWDPFGGGDSDNGSANDFYVITFFNWLLTQLREQNSELSL